MDWQSECEKLWGRDWIAPLSEVLGVNRRTVERWRSGAVTIPSVVDNLICDAMENVRQPRVMGAVFRMVAKGARPDDIRETLDRMESEEVRTLAGEALEVGRSKEGFEP